MHYVFKLNRTVGPDVNHDLSDVLKVKAALDRLGFLERPDSGIDEFPDQLMLEGIKRFQMAESLLPDKVMKPDGQTYMRMTERLREGNKFDAVLPSPPVYGGATMASTPAPGPTEDGFFGDREGRFDLTTAVQNAREFASQGAAIGTSVGGAFPVPVGPAAGAAIGGTVGGVGGFLSGFGNRMGNIGLVDPAAGP